MIQSYRDKRTREFAMGRRVKEFQAFERQAYRRIGFLDDAVALQDLLGLPSNRLEALGGDRAGQFSIRINTQWRICFVWDEGDTGPSDVEIVDYH